MSPLRPMLHSYEEPQGTTPRGLATQLPAETYYASRATPIAPANQQQQVQNELSEQDSKAQDGHTPSP